MQRNMADECQWEDPSKIVDVQPFATAVEVEDIRNRLESVESLLAHIPPEVLRAAESASPPPAQTPRGLRRLPSTSTHISFRNNAAFLHEPHDVHSGTGGNSEAELENDGEEAAVGALEELALGQRSGPSWMAREWASIRVMPQILCVRTENPDQAFCAGCSIVRPGQEQ